MFSQNLQWLEVNEVCGGAVVMGSFQIAFAFHTLLQTFFATHLTCFR